MNPGKGIPILTQLLGRYPIDKSDEEARGPEQESLSIEVLVSQAKIVDLEEWIQAPEEVARRSATPEPYDLPQPLRRQRQAMTPAISSRPWPARLLPQTGRE